MTKGNKDTAGDAATPAYPAGDLPIAVVRVPYGGVIATSTLVAVSGRLLVSDAGGRNVTVQPGRAIMPGYYLTPGQVQTITLADNATSRVYLDATGAASTTGGVLLAEVVTASGDISSVTDHRTLLYQGAQPKLLADLNADSKRITSLPLATGSTDAYDAAAVGYVRAQPLKPSVRVVATTNQALSGTLPTIDDVTLSEGDRVLLTGQTDPEDNGKWIAYAAGWERHPDSLAAYYLTAGAMVFVREGTANAKTLWIQVNNISDINTDAQEWQKMWTAS